MGPDHAPHVQVYVTATSAGATNQGLAGSCSAVLTVPAPASGCAFAAQASCSQPRASPDAASAQAGAYQLWQARPGRWFVTRLGVRRQDGSCLGADAVRGEQLCLLPGPACDLPTCLLPWAAQGVHWYALELSTSL